MSQANVNQGRLLSSRLSDALDGFDRAPCDEARDLPVITGFDVNEFLRPPDNVAVDFRDNVLADRGPFFNYDGRVVIEKAGRLETIMENGLIRLDAVAKVANIFQIAPKEGDVPQPPNMQILSFLLHNDLVKERMPEIHMYGKRPLYDTHFELHGTGYDPTTGYLIHGEIINVVTFVPQPTSLSPLERLPRRLREICIDFPFKTSIDLISYIGFLLTAILAHLFTAFGRPLMIFRGNQPNLGKTESANNAGRITDGKTPAPTDYTNQNDELGKRVLATMRTEEQSGIVLDNIKGVGGTEINSIFLESQAVASRLSLRKLGCSENDSRRNDYLWSITANFPKVSRDLALRSLQINLFYEGDAGQIRFSRNDNERFVLEHRAEILGELYGMIEHWKAAGRPQGLHPHRFDYWARTTGGILLACGFEGFLSNHQSSIAEINADADILPALFDHFVGRVPESPLPTQEWIEPLTAIGIGQDLFVGTKTDRGKTTKVGQLFSRLVNQWIHVELQGRPTRVRLVRVSMNGNRAGYYFEVECATELPTTPIPSSPDLPPLL